LKVVILAGGLGTRIAEETHLRPKPMVEIGGKPILWHIMKIYSTFGLNDFIVCCGYRGYVIKEYFANYFLHLSDVTFDVKNNRMEVHENHVEPWRVTLVDTGEHTQTGGRLKRVGHYLDEDDTFCFTYGDIVADVDITSLLRHHRESGALVTVTAVQPPARFGALDVDGDLVTSFQEKPPGDGMWINGGFFVGSPQVLGLIDDDDTIWENGPLEWLAAHRSLAAYRHRGFWQPMDTLRDRNRLEDLWASGEAPWALWTGRAPVGGRA
jgi:glucose-1-phosphate cytidylyltransferase